MVKTIIRKSLLFVGATILLCGAWISTAISGSLNISPITLRLDPQSPVGIMMIENRGGRDTIIELQPQIWLQQNGENTLTPTTELIATPAIFGLKAGERKPVRIGLLNAPKNSTEQEVAYRLEITETPSIVKDQTIQLRMQFSVPVFYTSLHKQNSAPHLNFNVTRHSTTNTLVLTAHNNGNRHARIVGLKLAESGENIPIQHGMASYILPRGMIEQRISIPEQFLSNSSVPSNTARTAILLYADPGFPGIREQKIVIGYEALHVSRD